MPKVDFDLEEEFLDESSPRYKSKFIADESDIKEHLIHKEGLKI